MGKGYSMNEVSFLHDVLYAFALSFCATLSLKRKLFITVVVVVLVVVFYNQWKPDHMIPSQLEEEINPHQINGIE